MSTRDETIETTSAWEVKVPLGLLILGLAILVIHGLAMQGATGGAAMLLGIGLLLLIYLPVTIAAMFIAAPLVDVTFGEFGPAIVKIAVIYVFTFAIQDVAATMAHPVLGWVPGLGASLALFSKAFELTIGEAVIRLKRRCGKLRRGGSSILTALAALRAAGRSGPMLRATAPWRRARSPEASRARHRGAARAS
jgi:hypothetical protein